MSAPQVRRTDRLMPDAEAREFLASGFAGRLATVGADGYPYVVPLLYVWMNDHIYTHNTRAQGHLRSNVEHDARACFEVDEPGGIFAYGRFECDTSVSYKSVIAFGRIAIIEDTEHKARFCDGLMAKYGAKDWVRPKGFYPRLDQITVYCLSVERLTGKQLALPGVESRWPAVDMTKSPNAKAPG